MSNRATMKQVSHSHSKDEQANGFCSEPQPSSTFNTTSSNGNSSTISSDALCVSVSRMQSTKMLEVIKEAIKNDAELISEKLLDYIVEQTSIDCKVGWCSSREMSDWVVKQLRDQVDMGQVWTNLKVFTIVHDLLWRGSQCFALSLRETGLAIIQFNHVMEIMQNTPQKNLRGRPLRCTLLGKTCTPCGSVKGSKSPSSGSELMSPCSGDARTEQRYIDFVLSFLGYLESLCEYRVRHPSVLMSLGKVESLETTDMSTLNEMCNDTFELLKCIAVSATDIPGSHPLSVFAVRKRLADVQPLSTICAYLLVRMLQNLFDRFSKCGEDVQAMADSNEPYEKVYSLLVEHKRVTVELFGRWYNTVYQYDRTVRMLRTHAQEVEANTGKKVSAIRQLRTFPPHALQMLHGHLKWLRAEEIPKPGDLSTQTSMMDSFSHYPSTALSFGSEPHSLSEQSNATAVNKLLDAGKQRLVGIENVWITQITAMLYFFEDGEAPAALAELRASLEGTLASFINVNSMVLQLQQQSIAELSSPTAALSEGTPIRPMDKDLGMVPMSPGLSESEIGKTCKSGEAASGPSSRTYVIRRDVSGGITLEPPSEERAASLSTFSSLPSGGVGSRDSHVMLMDMTEEMKRTEESIEALLQEEDVVIICNEPCSCNDTVKMADRFRIMRDKPLGSGAYGSVFRAWDDVAGSYLAAKEVSLDSDDGHVASVRRALKEYTVLTSLSHPNVVRVVAFMVVQNTGRIFMEWVPFGSILEVLRLSPNGALRESVVSQYAHDALSGLWYLHQRGVFHRDVKPANMLLSAEGRVKLTDFGTSTLSASSTVETSAVTGTVPYMAPETVQGYYSAASDIWALGCTVLEMITGRIPWTDLETNALPDGVPLLFKIGSLDDKSDRLHSQIKAGAPVPGGSGEILSEDLINFLDLALTVDRRKRSSAQQLLQHPFITKRAAYRVQREQAMNLFNQSSSTILSPLAIPPQP